MMGRARTGGFVRRAEQRERADESPLRAGPTTGGKMKVTGARPGASTHGAAALPRLAAVPEKWGIVLAVGVGSFMSAMGESILATILPVIQESFGSDVATVEWVVTVYLLVVSGLLLTCGRLGDLYGYKRIYTAGLAVFVLGSALCALAPTAPALVALRVVQALGAAALFANAPAILTRHFPACQRGQALGLQVTLTYLGLTLGPSLGGWLAHQAGWQSVFYLNLPLGLLAGWLSLRALPRDPPAAPKQGFDVLGALTLVGGLVGLLLALNRGGAWGWSSPGVLLLLGAGALLLGAFVAVERRVAAPMLRLHLFARPAFSAAVTSAVLNYMCIFAVIFLLPFYLIQGRGLSAAQAGLLLTAQPLLMALVAPWSGTLSDRIGARLPATLGMAVLATGLFVLARLGPTSPLGQVGVGLAVVGLGTGLFTSPNTSSLMGAAPAPVRGMAAALLATARHIGMGLGIALAGAIYTTVIAQEQGVDPTAAMANAMDASFGVAVGLALLGVLASALRDRRAPAG